MVRLYRKLEGISSSSGTCCYCRQNEHVEYVERGETDGEEALAARKRSNFRTATTVPKITTTTR